MRGIRGAFRQPEGPAWHGAALGYAIAAWAGGLAGLFHPSWLVNAGATLLLAHGMVIAAYLVHECGHNTIFSKQRHNVALGRFLTWLCGASYHRFEDIRYKHFRHHVDNDDVVWFDYERFFLAHPRLLAVTRGLEWAYVPAHDLLMHGIMAVNAFVIPERRAQRARNIAVLLVRGGIWLAALIFFPKAALLYALACVLMIHVLRFMDSLQHDYDYHLTLFTRDRAPHRGDTDYEQEHTFSVPLSLRHEWLNWLTLNFGYHNAHHARPDEPWYRLPALHRELYGDDPERVIPLRAQLRIMHRGRTRRIVKWDADAAPDAPTPRGAEFLRAAREARLYGGNAASFLTAF